MNLLPTSLLTSSPLSQHSCCDTYTATSFLGQEPIPDEIFMTSNTKVNIRALTSTHGLENRRHVVPSRLELLDQSTKNAVARGILVLQPLRRKRYVSGIDCPTAVLFVEAVTLVGAQEHVQVTASQESYMLSSVLLKSLHQDMRAMTLSAIGHRRWPVFLSFILLESHIMLL